MGTEVHSPQSPHYPGKQWEFLNGSCKIQQIVDSILTRPFAADHFHKLHQPDGGEEMNSPNRSGWITYFAIDVMGMDEVCSQ